MRGISKFSIRIFLLILLCVVVPLCGVGVYIRCSMEQFIQEKLSEKVLQNIARNERTICDELQNLAFLSNAFVYDEDLRKRMVREDKKVVTEELEGIFIGSQTVEEGMNHAKVRSDEILSK